MRPYWAYWASKKCTKNKPDIFAPLTSARIYVLEDQSLVNEKALSLINKQMGSTRIDRGAFKVGFKGWDWSMGAKRAFQSSYSKN